jgi:hypothetical protein
MTGAVTLLIATVPERSALLRRALLSAHTQNLPFVDVIVEMDGPEGSRIGPAAVRNRALQKVRTAYSAVLDDDDWLLPGHAEALVGALERAPWAVLAHGACALQRGGVLVEAPEEWRRRWARPFAENAGDLLAGRNYIPVTTVFRTEAALAVGGYGAGGWSDAEDLDLLIALVREHGPGAIVGPGDGAGIPIGPTWVYNHDSQSAMWGGARRLR